MDEFNEVHIVTIYLILNIFNKIGVYNRYIKDNS